MSSSPQFDTTSGTTVASDVIGLQLQSSLLSTNLINDMTRMIIISKSFTDAIAGIIENQLKQYENRIKQLEAELKQINGHWRDLIIHGIPFTQGEDTSQIVLDLAKSVGVNLDIKDFYATHRLGSRGKQHSPIIAAFIRYSDRQQLFSKRKDLGKGINKQVFINEHLPSLNHQLFIYARLHSSLRLPFCCEMGNAPAAVPQSNIQLLTRIESLTGYRFKNLQLLEQAFTHDSVRVGNRNAATYQRLEFLGDSVLHYIITEYLYQQRPTANEGELTRARSNLVDKVKQSEIASTHGLADLVDFAPGVDRTKFLGNHKFVEALIGAIHQDGGVEQAKRSVYKLWNLT
ncbi:unnamed protein product [Didymodactylos carnosus]|uniref:RNase III domain-containing protein n=1 Tax=Didymodactylos carnosus TaxID=1234261 RepID=A0A814LIY1_9BILA|nr:unnamed protein product [Didymodactylos carnosus]CAF1065931.1 unnamed protein product [Didymodactylos carnosus]CAF3646592.1 unnamed protein product [Didymodactylos carnosus]CAF3833620.1 unnamed protein product [Didymodactylos carnosus]